MPFIFSQIIYFLASLIMSLHVPPSFIWQNCQTLSVSLTHSWSALFRCSLFSFFFTQKKRPKFWDTRLLGLACLGFKIWQDKSVHAHKLCHSFGSKPKIDVSEFLLVQNLVEFFCSCFGMANFGAKPIRLYVPKTWPYMSGLPILL